MPTGGTMISGKRADIRQDLPTLQWFDVKETLPRPGECVVATDGHARWFDVYDDRRAIVGPWLGSPMTIKGGSHCALPTHWHPTLDLPKGK